MGEAWSFRLVVIVASNATAIALIDLPTGGTLKGATVGVPSGTPPIRASVSIFPNGPRKSSFSYLAGWIRGQTSFPGSGGIRRFDDAPLEKERPQAQLELVNNTGAERRATITVVGN